MLKINDFVLRENLPAHQKLNYKDFEVIILPNEVTQNERLLEKKYPFLRLIPTHNITRPAQKRDRGAKEARGEIFAFIDDDAYPTKNWLEQATHLLNTAKVDAICGPGILPGNAEFWEKVFDEILKTWIGSGGLSYRFTPGKKQFVDDFPSMNFLIKKEVFLRLEGFNSNYWPGEDSKLCEDLVYKLKGKILYSPDVKIYHHRRNKLLPYLKQHGQYGFHRGAFLAHGDRNSRHLCYLAPTLFFLYLTLLPFVLFILHSIPYMWLFYVPLISYIILLSTIFLSASKNTNSLKIACSSTIVLFLMHVVYGVKFINGFIVGVAKKEKIY